MKRTELLRDIRKVSTVPEDVPDREAVAHAVERLRDLVRRALLARICLATGDRPRWPLHTDESIDAVLVDDECRRAWREAWRDALATIDAPAAADRPWRQVTRSAVVYDEGWETQARGPSPE